MAYRSLGCAVLLGVALGSPGVAARTPIKLQIDQGLALFVGEPQSEAFSPSYGLSVKVSPWFSGVIAPQVGYGWLYAPAQGSGPAGGAHSVSLGARFRPQGLATSDRDPRGFFVDLEVAYVRTGPYDRFSYSPGLGYDFSWGPRWLSWGPFLRYTQILQPDDLRVPQDAKIIMVGVSGGVIVAAGQPATRPPASRPTASRPTAWCGNGQLDPNEDCDGAHFRVRQCVALNSRYHGGDVRCSGDCHYDFSPCAYCGDAKKNGPEQCDGRDLGGSSCGTFGKAGALQCKGDCNLDYSQCRSEVAATKEPDYLCKIPESGYEIRFHFERQKVVLSEKDAQPRLAGLAAVLQENRSCRVCIAGHASPDEWSHNFKLSRERADYVRNLLIARGVEEGRLRTMALGKGLPVADPRVVDNRGLNRRVSIRRIGDGQDCRDLYPGAVPK